MTMTAPMTATPITAIPMTDIDIRTMETDAIDRWECDTSKLSNIPHELQDLQNWIPYRVERSEGEEKYKKYPANHETGYKHDRKDKSNWRTFVEARTNLESGFLDGIGISFTPDDGIVCIDFDNCFKPDPSTGEVSLDRTVSFWVKRFNSYTELSSSGNGLHVFVKGKINGMRGAYKDSVCELYSDWCILITGDVYKGYADLTDNQEAIDELYRLNFELKDKEDTPTFNLQPSPQLTDDEILTKLKNAGNKDKFNKLYKGDADLYNSASDADMAVANLIAFYTQDPEQIERIMKGSGLKRGKWDRTDYLPRTITKAITTLGSTWQPALTVEEEELPFVHKTRNGDPKINIPALTAYMLEKYDLIYYQNLFRCKKDGYYAYVDGMDSLVYKEIPRSLKDSEIAKKVMNNLKCEERVKISESDITTGYICFKNGAYHIQDRILYPYDDPKVKNLILLHQIPYNYNPDCEHCSITDQYFTNACGDRSESENEEEIDFLLQLIGVTISDYRDFKCWFFITGKKDTGKSTFVRILQQLLTDPSTEENHYSSCTLGELQETEKGSPWRIFTGKANLVAEESARAIKNDTKLKAITGGGDVVSYDKKYADAVTGIPRTVLIHAGNAVPMVWVKGDSNALLDRMVIYEFKNPVKAESIIPNIDKKINMEYLIYLALQAFHKFEDNGHKFDFPACVERNREELHEESDDVHRFAKECIRKGEDNVSVRTLYEEFKEWGINDGIYRDCDDYKLRSFSQRMLVSRLKREFDGRFEFKRNLSCPSKSHEPLKSCFVLKMIKSDCFCGIDYAYLTDEEYKRAQCLETNE